MLPAFLPPIALNPFHLSHPHSISHRPRPRLRCCAPTPASRAGITVTAPTAPIPPSPAGITFTLKKPVLPADTDYSGSLWHGAYVRWLEEARVLHLAAAGVDYSALVSVGRTELVVTSLSVQYKTAARLGDELAVEQTFDLAASSAVRLRILSEFKRGDELIATAEVQLTPVGIDTGRVVRRWPEGLKEAMRAMFDARCYAAGVDVPEIPAWLNK